MLPDHTIVEALSDVDIYSNGADELGPFGAGAGKGRGGPESVTEFLYCRDTAGPPLWGGNVGSGEENKISPGRLPGQGCKAANRAATSTMEGWAVVLPSPGGSTDGGGRREDQDVDPSEAEYCRAIYCNATDSGPV